MGDVTTIDRRGSLHWELAASLEVGHVALTLAQADAALQTRPMPHTLGELHPAVRERYTRAATVALMLLNRDAELFAETAAGLAAFEAIDDFTAAHHLPNWRELEHPLNQGDELEMLVYRMVKQAVQRFRQTLSGTVPGLAKHLWNLQRMRVTDTDPRLADQ